MNINTIEFRDFFITVPKLNKQQYLLLRYLPIAINNKSDSTYFMDADLFSLEKKDLQNLLKKNIEITVVSKTRESWSIFNVLNDIEIKDGRIYFTPAKIIKEIITESISSPKNSYLKYILLNGIRRKQTLLLIDYLVKLDNQGYFKITVVNLKHIFELQETQYKNWYAFKTSILDKVVNEINERTNYFISYEIAQTGSKRKVVELLFNYQIRNT